MPVFNGETYLPEAIDSILAQTYGEFILLIVNDASTDRTQQIIEEYAAKDPRVQFLLNPKNLGAAKSRNIAIDRATTEFIAFMDADDIAVSSRFEKQLNFLKAHPEVGLCGSWFTYLGKENKVIDHHAHHEQLKVDFLSHCPVQNSSVMLRKPHLGALRFDEDMVVAEDYSLYSQLIAKTKFHNLQESLIFYRWHDKNISQTEGDRLAAYDFEVVARQLQHLGIATSHPDLEHYVRAVWLKKKQSLQTIKKVIVAANDLKERNKKYQYYEQDLLEKQIDQTIIRTIRNAQTYDMDFYKYLKKESGYFKKIPKLDRSLIFFKSRI